MATGPRPGDAVVFGAQNGLWLTLAALAAAAAVLTLVIAGADAAGNGPGAATGTVLWGGGATGLLALGAWFSARQRREVVLDREGITVQGVDGKVYTRLPWSEVRGIETRRLANQPTRPLVLVRRHDNRTLLIDPQQVRDTAALEREARRLHGANAERRAGSGE
ncbi:MAG: hypothetical protein M3Q65_18710 [Chloroflexota bacterium]|nr:hypothetical protein [Chloroflexota bacterium]